MTYKEFNKKFNKRDSNGVITHTSIIDINGNVIFSGTLDECEKYSDDNIEVLECNKNHFPCRFAIKGVEIPFIGFTNVGEAYYNKYYANIF